ncbi:MAG: hypothetical protein ACYDDU_10015 [Dermatophilaceae bacterium]
MQHPSGRRHRRTCKTDASTPTIAYLTLPLACPASHQYGGHPAGWMGSHPTSGAIPGLV